MDTAGSYSETLSREMLIGKVKTTDQQPLLAGTSPGFYASAALLNEFVPPLLRSPQHKCAGTRRVCAPPAASCVPPQCAPGAGNLLEAARGCLNGRFPQHAPARDYRFVCCESTELLGKRCPERNEILSLHRHAGPQEPRPAGPVCEPQSGNAGPRDSALRRLGSSGGTGCAPWPSEP